MVSGLSATFDRKDGSIERDRCNGAAAAEHPEKHGRVFPLQYTSSKSRLLCKKSTYVCHKLGPMELAVLVALARCMVAEGERHPVAIHRGPAMSSTGRQVVSATRKTQCQHAFQALEAGRLGDALHPKDQSSAEELPWAWVVARRIPFVGG